MSTYYYLPDDDNGRMRWLNNFAAKIGGYAADLDIDPADVTQIENDALDWEEMLGFLVAEKSFHKAVVSYKNLLGKGNKAGTELGALPLEPEMPTFTSTVKENIFGRVTKLVAAIKVNNNYSPSIGKDLGIIAAGTGISTSAMEHSAKASELKPVLKIILNKGNRPWLRWVKGISSALQLMVNRGDGKGFVLLMIASHNAYVDKSPLPEIDTAAVWKYKAIYLDHNEEPMGEWSNESKITVTGV
ncbi:MAG: hypothetical protein ACYDCN_00600 [Bacteroidia bacterium]